MAGMSGNHETLQTYEENPAAYIDRTPQVLTGEFREFIDRVRFATPVDGQILEIGSATGRDATYLQSHGYKNVIRTDAARSFVDHMNSINGDGHREAHQFNLLHDELPEEEFDTVLASAVLVHFTAEECARALERVRVMLKPDGVFAFSVKMGDGEEWSDHKVHAPRYFNYWQPDDLATLLETSGYGLIDANTTADQRWLFMIAQKNA